MTGLYRWAVSGDPGFPVLRARAWTVEDALAEGYRPSGTVHPIYGSVLMVKGSDVGCSGTGGAARTAEKPAQLGSTPGPTVLSA